MWSKEISAEIIRSYINFDGSDDKAEVSLQASLQSKGVAALWKMLCEQHYAYLADEVGMGKTRQAMGVIATQFLNKPDSRVVIVCPGEPLQEQWSTEWDFFLKNCLNINDGSIKNSLHTPPPQVLEVHHRLRDFAGSLLLGNTKIHMLRYSSFRRPLWFKRDDKKLPNDVSEEYMVFLNEIGLNRCSEEETASITAYKQADSDKTRLEIIRKLNGLFCKRLGSLLAAHKVDLVVFDEAQYLRHTGNQQNSNIISMFRKNAERWLFLSATPIHTSNADICSLDKYLCTRDEGFPSGYEVDCKACYEIKCPHFNLEMMGASGELDLPLLLKKMLVRRQRKYLDYSDNEYGKLDYRSYSRERISSNNDPFTSLAMALVQKRLVSMLQGNDKSFRQGELSSFESLASSVKNHCISREGAIENDPHLASDCSSKGGKEFEQSSALSRKDRSKKSPDRSFIDNLNTSFRKEMGDKKEQLCLPHAKVTSTVEKSFEGCFKNGSNNKKIIFVRRLDTVDELVNELLKKFQGEVNERIRCWSVVLADSSSCLITKNLNTLKENDFSWFWNLNLSEEDRKEEIKEDSKGEVKEDVSKCSELPYYKALLGKKKKGRQKSGLMFSFRNRLLIKGERKSNNPFGGFLAYEHKQLLGKEEDSLNDIDWRDLVNLVLKESDISSAEWVLKSSDSAEDGYKIASLQRCILQSMRQTDFLVDLYILHRFVKEIKPEKVSLPQKMLWFLNNDRGMRFPEPLEEYIENWREKIRRWILHFELIVDKCLRSNSKSTWESVCNDIDGVFFRMKPVYGRSGRLRDKNAIRQFKFPVHPNVLVCTDVLKEGVDLHLFCDEVENYGVAWTPGDLEQRIGRVDRFGSAYSRKISKFKFSDISCSHPKLKVGFPYLADTLDEMQVKRVLSEKCKCDCMLDLGLKERDAAKISVADLSWADSPILPDSFSNNIVEYMPECSFHAGDKVLRGYKDEIERINSCNSEFKDFNRKIGVKLSYLQRLNLASFELPLGTDDYEKWFAGCSNVRILVCARDKSPLDVSSEVYAGEAVGVRREFVECFELNRRVGTVTAVIELDPPFVEGAEDCSYAAKAEVLLEELDKCWVLRTPISCGAIEYNLEKITEYCRDNRFGQVLFDRGVVWFVVLLAKRISKDEINLIPHIATNVADCGARFRMLSCKGCVECDVCYRAVYPFPVQSEREFYFEEFGHALSLKGTEMNENKNFMADVYEWFTEHFTELVRHTGDSDVEMSPVTMLNGGVLHLSTQSRGRVCLQAYLAMHKLVDSLLDEPCLVLEIVATSSTAGSKPNLVPSTWEELPHIERKGWAKNCPDEWGGLIESYVRTEKYRHIVLYCSPLKLGLRRGNHSGRWEDLFDLSKGIRFKKMEFVRTLKKILNGG